MVTFVALYRGPTVAEVEVVGVSADPELVAEFATRMLQRSAPLEDDPVLAHVHRAERRALRLVHKEARAELPGAG